MGNPLLLLDLSQSNLGVSNPELDHPKEICQYAI